MTDESKVEASRSDTPTAPSRRYGRSESLVNLAPALAKAMGEIGPAFKESTNPHFKSRYADLADCHAVAIGPLTRNGFSFPMFPSVSISHGLVTVTALLLHESGEYLEGTIALPIGSGANAHAIGSAETYGRRYLYSMVGVVADDDDGEAAVGRGDAPQAPGPRQGTQPTPPKPKPNMAPVNAAAQEQAKANAAAEEARVKAESLEQQRKATEAGNAAAKAEADRKAREVEAERARILAENAANLPAEQPDPEPVDDGKPLQDDTRKRLGAAFREAGFDNMSPEGREQTTAFMVKVTGKASIKQMTDAEGRLLLLHVEGMKKSA